MEARELGRVRVVGKAVPIRVYELLCRKGRLTEDWQRALVLYRRGLDLFNKRDFSGARDAFGEVLKVIPDDPPSKLYFNASSDYAQIPPDPQTWDGVFNLTAK
ncbi:MAG: tetratricopeptide repeat protein [Elusimicrobia bacterium]|nr:tetratricopeptide repeat protein [Elusimicrobiota bacterium]